MPKGKKDNKQHARKPAFTSKQRLSAYQNKKKQSEHEQDPEQYALNTASQKSKDGAKAAVKVVHKLADEMPFEPISMPPVPRNQSMQSARLRQTERAPKNRDAPEVVYHKSSHELKSVDIGLKDKSAVAERQETAPPPNMAKQAHIRHKQVEHFKKQQAKFKTEYPRQPPASDLSEVGISVSETPQIPETGSVNDAHQQKRIHFLKQAPKRSRGLQGENTQGGKSGYTQPSNAHSGASGYPGNIPASSNTSLGGSNPAVLPSKEQSDQTGNPDSDSKKLKTSDRQTGTLKTREKAELKHHIGGFKEDEGKGLKSAESLQNGGILAARGTQTSHSAMQMGANTAKAGSGVGVAAAKSTAGAATHSATGGVTAAIEIVKKGKDKLQELAERNNTDENENTPKLGCFGVVACTLFVPCFLVFFLIFGNSSFSAGTNKNLSAEVLSYMPSIQAACQKYEIPEYAYIVAAIMMQESGGNINISNGDLMQAAESQGWPAGTPIEPELSIDYGVKYFKSCLVAAGMPPPGDISGISLALQGYNFGAGYISWALKNYGGYTKENAIEFAQIQAASLGWNSYGDVSYVDHVLRYYEPGGEYGGVGEIGLIGDGLIAYPMPGYTWETYNGHSGIDINTGGVNGKPIMAAGNGIVTYVSNGWQSSDGTSGMAAYGNVVFIDHEGTSYQTRYGHMSYCIVNVGDYVQQGQVIGYVGSTGNSTGPHLHFEIVIDGERWGSTGRCYAEQAFPQYRAN